MARVIKSSVDGWTISWAIEGFDKLSIDVAQLDQSVKDRGLLFGIGQTVGDAAAKDKGTAPAEKYAAMRERIETLMSGNWSKERTGGGARPFDIGLVVTALANVKTSGDVDKANRAIDAVAEKRGIPRVEAAKLFAADEAIAVEMTRVKAQQRGAPKLSADDLLAEMTEGNDEDAS